MIGIVNGMVMQRNGDNVSEILITEIDEILSATYSGKLSGEIKVNKVESGWKLTGIPAGGPYIVSINGQVFRDIYVGDLWLLAGQSNMQGVGWLTEEDKNYWETKREQYLNSRKNDSYRAE